LIICCESYEAATAVLVIIIIVFQQQKRENVHQQNETMSTLIKCRVLNIDNDQSMTKAQRNVNYFISLLSFFFGIYFSST
jgi:hypothetical protein